jgi:hypothetical protein
MIEITQDKITGQLAVFPSNLNPQAFENELFRYWIFANEDEAVEKWRVLCTDREAKVRSERFDGLQKISKIFS